jgi:hypothetical protein
MRKITVLAIMLFTLSVALAGVGLGTQEAEHPQLTPEEFFQLLRQDIQTERVALVGGAMGFTSQQASAFWPIYEEYEVELEQIGDRQVALILEYARTFESMTDEKARELGTEVLSIQEQRTALLRSYFERFDQAMGPIIATRFLQVENQLNNLIQVQVAADIPLIGRQ